jgi:hypothetical protein
MDVLGSGSRADEPIALRVLGIDVPDSLLARWSFWLAPALQPFFVANPASVHAPGSAAALTAESRDTFKVWKIGSATPALWLDENSFASLTEASRKDLVRQQVAIGRGGVPTVRTWADLLDPALLRAQAGGHRFVWWPWLVGKNPGAILDRVILKSPGGDQDDQLPSRHTEVPPATWSACRDVLPGIRTLAGTFPMGSGPNCFGTVMAATGVLNTANEWMQREPFEGWLAACARRGGDDNEPGTVLVWRDRDGVAVHAAVTLGSGWGLQKASQEWWTPRCILSVGAIIRSNRVRGWRLERHRISRTSDMEVGR